MKCQFCQRIVTQSEVDRADSIHPSPLTQCEECANAQKLASEHEDAMFEENGEAAYGRDD
jgi:hypothetical protein